MKSRSWPRRLASSPSQLGRRLAPCPPLRPFQCRRYAKPALAASPESFAAVDYRQQAEAAPVATLLGDVSNLLSHSLGDSSSWSDRLEAAREDLQTSRPGRIGVYGDELSGARDLVSALLQDPFADTSESRAALLGRHIDTNTEVLTISHGTDHIRHADSLQVPSEWLNATGFDLQEIQPTEISDTMYLASDLSIIVLDPYRLASDLNPRALAAALARGHIFFVVNGEIPSAATEASLRSKVESQVGAKVPVIFTQSTRALTALDAITESMDIYQTEFVASRVGDLQAHLSSVATTFHRPQIATAEAIARIALGQAERLVSAERTGNEHARGLISTLRSSSSRAAVDAKHLSVISRGIEGGMVEGGVQHSLTQTSRGIASLFQDRWSWLNLVTRARADDVGGEMRVFLEGDFGKDLERNIVFETGQLAQVQSQISQDTDAKLRQLATSPSLSSPVLVNHLSTLALSTPRFEPASLLSPVTTRRSQLLRETVPRLQTAAQRSLLVTLGVSACGLSASWASYVLQLLTTPTAAGTALLGIVAALALGQRLWGRAQVKFWNDWTRITAMLRGDLQNVLDEAIQSRLLAKPNAAADGLERLLRRRDERLEALDRAISDLRTRL